MFLCDAITHPSPNFNGDLAKLPLKWMSNHIPYFHLDVIIYPYDILNAGLPNKGGIKDTLITKICPFWTW